MTPHHTQIMLYNLEMFYTFSVKAVDRNSSSIIFKISHPIPAIFSSPSFPQDQIHSSGPNINKFMFQKHTHPPQPHPPNFP